MTDPHGSPTNPFFVGGNWQIQSVGWGRGPFVVVQIMQTAGSNSAFPNTNGPWVSTVEIEGFDLPVINGANSDFDNLQSDPYQSVLLNNRANWIKQPKFPAAPIPDPGRATAFDVGSVDLNNDVFKNYYAFAFTRISSPFVNFTAFNDAIFLDVSRVIGLTEAIKNAKSFTIKWAFWRHYSSFENVPVYLKITSLRFTSKKNPYDITPQMTGILFHQDFGQGEGANYAFFERNFPTQQVISEFKSVFSPSASSTPSPTVIARVTSNRQAKLSSFTIGSS